MGIPNSKRYTINEFDGYFEIEFNSFRGLLRLLETRLSEGQA